MVQHQPGFAGICLGAPLVGGISLTTSAHALPTTDIGQVLQPAVAGGTDNDVGIDSTLRLGSCALVLSEDGSLPNSAFPSDGFNCTEDSSADPDYRFALQAQPGSDPGHRFSFLDGRSRRNDGGLNVELTSKADTAVPGPTSLALVASLAACPRSTA